MTQNRITITLELDEFTSGYIECALWSSNDEADATGGEPLDSNYSVSDIDDETMCRIIADCRVFQDVNRIDIERAVCEHAGYTLGHAGHDYWLTRNGHGAGFWDGDIEETLGERLTAHSKLDGECSLYVGDDGKIYSA